MKSKFWKEFFKALIISAILAFAIRYFVIQPFKVQGASMQPSFYPNDYLIVDEISPRFKDFQRGEVIVFKHGPSFYIKRIIGLPGEKLEIKNSKIYINNLVLDEEYLIESTTGEKNIKLQEYQYFVLGDNRDASSDSRNWGALEKSDIVGRVWLRLLPLSKINKFNAPSYY